MRNETSFDRMGGFPAGVLSIQQKRRTLNKDFLSAFVQSASKYQTRVTNSKTESRTGVSHFSGKPQMGIRRVLGKTTRFDRKNMQNDSMPLTRECVWGVL